MGKADRRGASVPTMSAMSVITLSDWRDNGRTRKQLNTAMRDGALLRLRRGVVTDVADPTPLSLHRLRLEAAAPFLGTSTCFAHESAAVLHGLPLLAPRLEEVVAVRFGGGHGAITGTLHARRAPIPESDLDVVDGFPVTSLARTVSDLVRRLPFPEALMVADAGLRAGLVLDELVVRTAAGRGCRMAETALTFADARAESPGESLSRARIHRAGLPAPELQAELCDEEGEFLGRVDFWWDAERVAGEFDGMAKYSELLKPGQSAEVAIRAEKDREQRLQASGYRVVRWTWRDLWNGQLEHRVERALNPAPHRGPAQASRARTQELALERKAGPRG